MGSYNEKGVGFRLNVLYNNSVAFVRWLREVTYEVDIGLYLYNVQYHVCIGYI